ncbi:MAG: Pyocin activator protein PrtN [Rhodobacteraceae bacterium]|nr:MAG: Pyocin activator protein PrtN [Paracoccaceae bacterium]
MQTIWLLMAKHEGSAVISADRVRLDYFEGMSREVFIKKVDSGEIPLPLTRLGQGQKATKCIHITDLAKYIDDCTEAARKELKRKIN